MALGTNYTKNSSVLQDATTHYKMCVLSKDMKKAEYWLSVIDNSKYSEATKKKYRKSCLNFLKTYP